LPQYAFSYTTDKPTAQINGSGQVGWFIIPYSKPEDADDWEPIPGTDKLFYVPADELALVNAMPHNTAPQKQAKNAALIALILDNAHTENTPHVGWLEHDLARIVESNDLATAAASDAHDYIAGVLGQSYPVRFMP
jgi:hypothetical protein